MVYQLFRKLSIISNFFIFPSTLDMFYVKSKLIDEKDTMYVFIKINIIG